MDKIDAVHQEIPKVRKDLGYPPLVTPTSQLVGAQAVLNVLSGQRYQTITNEVKLYCQGKYGRPPGKINNSLRKKAIGNTDSIEGRPADLLANEFSRLQKEAEQWATREEDILSYAMFPDLAVTFFKERASGDFQPEPLVSAVHSAGDTLHSQYTISLHGETYDVKVAGFGETHHHRQACYLWIDGVPEKVIIEAKNSEQGNASEAVSEPAALRKGDVTVSMPGTIFTVNIPEEDLVKKGQALLVLEAMKMETEIVAPQEGRVTAVYCQKGDKVTPAQALLHIESK